MLCIFIKLKEGAYKMKEIFEQYGGVIVTVIAVMALIVIIQFLMSDTGVISQAFQDIIADFLSAATNTIE